MFKKIILYNLNIIKIANHRALVLESICISSFSSLWGGGIAVIAGSLARIGTGSTALATSTYGTF